MERENPLLVGVLGLGTVGLPTAAHISKFFRVKGYDLKPETVQRALLSGVDATVHWGDVSSADVFVLVASGTGAEDGGPDFAAVRDLMSKISDDSPSSLVCVEATLPVGTCRNLSRELGLKYVAHCPHRYWQGDPLGFGVVQPRVLGAVDQESLERAQKFYQSLGVPVHLVSSIEVAEMSKIAENAYTFVRISFAEELSLICRKVGISFQELREACNTKLMPKWTVGIFEAREGILGRCLPKDTRYLWSVLKSPLLTGAMKADEEYRTMRNSGTRAP